MTDSYRLFAYGTLLDPTIQRNIIGREVTATPATLPGFVRREVNLGGVTYPRIEPEADAFVEGAVLEGITEVELARVDGYEGDDYARVLVTLTDGTTAFTYVNPEGTDR